MITLVWLTVNGEKWKGKKFTSLLHFPFPHFLTQSRQQSHPNCYHHYKFSFRFLSFSYHISNPSTFSLQKFTSNIINQQSHSLSRFPFFHFLISFTLQPKHTQQKRKGIFATKIDALNSSTILPNYLKHCFEHIAKYKALVIDFETPFHKPWRFLQNTNLAHWLS